MTSTGTNNGHAFIPAQEGTLTALLLCEPWLAVRRCSERLKPWMSLVPVPFKQLLFRITKAFPHPGQKWHAWCPHQKWVDDGAFWLSEHLIQL
jgi:hypothetical protein